jgi:hypothetical protein
MAQEKLASRAEMHRDGWKDTQINKVDCIRLGNMITEWHPSGFITPEGILKIVAKLGEPRKIHTLGGRVTTLEY